MGVRDITHNRILGISITILSSDVYSVQSESCFYTFGRIDWFGWRLAHGEDGRGWPTGVPQEIPHLWVFPHVNTAYTIFGI